MSLIQADSHDELVETLDARLRDVVRKDGIDPQRDAGLVRKFADRIVAEHHQRSLTGVVVPVDDHDLMVEELVARVSGFGPLQRYLDDPRFALGIWSPTRLRVTWTISQKPASARRRRWEHPGLRPAPGSRSPE